FDPFLPEVFSDRKIEDLERRFLELTSNFPANEPHYGLLAFVRFIRHADFEGGIDPLALEQPPKLRKRNRALSKAFQFDLAELIEIARAGSTDFHEPHPIRFQLSFHRPHP